MILRHCSIMAISHQQIMQATNFGHFGDFFVLKQIARNTNTMTFIDLMSELAISKIENKNGRKSS